MKLPPDGSLLRSKQKLTLLTSRDRASEIMTGEIVMYLSARRVTDYSFCWTFLTSRGVAVRTFTFNESLRVFFEHLA
jgi:hypothetical protein